MPLSFSEIGGGLTSGQSYAQVPASGNTSAPLKGGKSRRKRSGKSRKSRKSRKNRSRRRR